MPVAVALWVYRACSYAHQLYERLNEKDAVILLR